MVSNFSVFERDQIGWLNIEVLSAFIKLLSKVTLIVVHNIPLRNDWSQTECIIRDRLIEDKLFEVLELVNKKSANLLPHSFSPFSDLGRELEYILSVY